MTLGSKGGGVILGGKGDGKTSGVEDGRMGLDVGECGVVVEVSVAAG